jgi:hypothetical protein
MDSYAQRAGGNLMEVIIVKEAKEYVEANYPNDPLLKRIVMNLLDQLPKMEITDNACSEVPDNG